MLKPNEDEIISKWVSSPDGRTALQILREQYYDVDSFDENPLIMARIGGERELISYLIEMQEE